HEICSSAGEFYECDARRYALNVCLLRCEVRNMDQLFCSRDTVKAGTWPGTNHRLSPPRFGKCGRRTIQGSKPKCVAFAKPQVPKMRFADAHCVLQHLFKHGLEVARRTTDDLEHVGRGDLP